MKSLIKSLDVTKVWMYLFAIMLLSFHSMLFANVAMAQGISPAQGNNIKYYHPGEEREVDIRLNVNNPRIINGSMWMNIDSFVTASDANARNWEYQIESAKRHIRQRLMFLTGGTHSDINIEFPNLQQGQQKSTTGYEIVTFSFSKHVRGVWEIDVPQDMKSLNIEMIVGRKSTSRRASAGKSMTLII